jgi:hypothetical protein
MKRGLRLIEDYETTVCGVRILVPAGFDWDGATIPRAFWSIVGGPFDPQIVAASLVHDWLYWTHQVSRGLADRIFYELAKEAGCSSFRRRSMYRAVKIFGGSYYKRTDVDIVYAMILSDLITDDGRKPSDYRIDELFSI